MLPGDRYILHVYWVNEIIKERVMIIEVNSYKNQIVVICLDRINGYVLPMNKIVVNNGVIVYHPGSY